MDLMEEIEFNLSLVRPSGCGKANFVKNVLENCEDVINEEPDSIWVQNKITPLVTSTT